MAELKTRILLRNDVLTNWSSKNPILGKGEFAAVYDPSVSGEGRKIRVKVGDGVTAFNSLPYVADYDTKVAEIEAALDTKIAKTAETYNLPYYFEVIYAADKVTVKDYTVDLNTGEKREYSLDIAAATESQAGIMTAADKVEVNKVANKADTTYVDTKDAETLASAKQYTDEQIAALPKVNYKVVETLPAPSAEYDFNVCRTIFLVKDTAVGADVYNEFVCIKNDQNVYVWEKIGDTRIDLSAYRKAADQDVIDDAIKADIAAEQAAREAADIDLSNRKVEKEITSAAGKALIFNEADGGGAKFEATNGTASFAGVNSDTNGGIGAQLYDIDVAANKGAKLDVTKNGIFYTQGDASAQPAATRDVEDNEIAVKKNVSDEAATRLAADTTLQSNIDSEARTRANADTALQSNIDAETAARIAADDTKTDKQVAGTNGTAYIFNEADGGGAKFVHNDGTESFVGVNDGGENGLVAQIYADKLVDGKWQGAKIDVKNTGIYYTVGNKSAAERDVEANEIAVKGNVSAEATRAQAAEAALNSAKQDKFDIINGGDASDWE